MLTFVWLCAILLYQPYIGVRYVHLTNSRRCGMSTFDQKSFMNKNSDSLMSISAYLYENVFQVVLACFREYEETGRYPQGVDVTVHLMSLEYGEVRWICEYVVSRNDVREDIRVMCSEMLEFWVHEKEFVNKVVYNKI